MVQAQTKRVGTVEEYVLAINEYNAAVKEYESKGAMEYIAAYKQGKFYGAACAAILDCEVCDYILVNMLSDIRLQFMQYILPKHNVSEATQANIVAAYAKTMGAINIKMSFEEATRFFDNKERVKLFKRILGDAKHVILVDSL